jgi:phosphosulfolactate synthase
MSQPVTLPARGAKPRSDGRTHIIDKGLPIGLINDHLQLTADFVDLVKFGWGTSVVTPNLTEKLNAYRARDVDVCFGGTLFELAYLQGRIDEYTGWLRELGITAVEISDGCLEMDGSDKLRLIEQLSDELIVFSEVGSKDAAAIVTPARWVRAITQELEAGAAYVILEGRESGTAGMYRESGEIRMGLIDEILESDIPVSQLVFEAPTKAQQVWLIKHIGPTINLGNIAPEDALPLETLRLGLRADTLLAIHRPAPRG